jgi:regulator of sirC expression with transglutaminase-like and TPR domain
LQVDPARARNQARSRLRSMINGGEDAIVMDVCCLLICQLAGRSIVIDDELAELDALAAGIETSSFEGVMAGLFAGPNALRGNADSYYSVANSLLSDVRRTGLGLPITLSVLAMEVGRRKGVAIAGVGMPGHFLVGDGTGADRFADPFNGVRVFDASGAKELFDRVIGGQAPWNDAYLRPTSHLDIAFRIVNNIKVAATKNVADRQHMPWVLEVLSWFPQGAPFDPAAADRAVAPFN